MSIKEDAFELLKFIYDEYVGNRRITINQLLEKFSEWEGHRIDRAVKYLRDIEAIEIILTLGNTNGLQNFVFRKITPKGISLIEDV